MNANKHLLDLSESLRAVVFDFDGTLVSAPPGCFIKMRAETREALLPFVDISAAALEGPILENLDRICAGLSPQDAHLAKNAAMKAIEDVEVETALLCAVFPFSRPMLAALRERGMRLAVITRNCPRAVSAAFPDIREYVDCILTREDVPNVKPHPDHLLRALEILKVEPACCLMVGDHPMDIQTGKRAGTRTAGVAGGGTSLDRLEKELPDILAVDAAEVMRKAFGKAFFPKGL